jgi:hypothetical protein
LLLFFVTFVAVGIRLWRTSKDTVTQHAQLPLNDSPKRH